MKESIEILSKLFGDKASFLFNIDGFSRNSLFVYSVNGKKVVLKKFKEEKFAKKEKFFYEIFNGVCNIPKMYFSEQDFLVTDFVEASKGNPLEAVKDWAKIHSRFLNDQILNNPFIEKRKLKNLSDYVLSHQEIFGHSAMKLSKELINIERINYSPTIVHGDLYGNNILSCEGKNCYIDFEYSGKGNAVEDLSLLLLNHPEIKKEIIKTYRSNISFDYSGIEEDIRTKMIEKGTHLIIGLKDAKMPSELKRKIHGKFLKVLESNLNQLKCLKK